MVLTTAAQTFSSSRTPWLSLSVLLFALMVLAGCGSTSHYAGSKDKSATGSSIVSAKNRGGYYLDDGPPDNPPANLDAIPDAIPRIEALRPANMRPYVALGQTFTPMTSLTPYKAKGIASWYGRRYHGRQTSSGEVYDMYAMTAAHPTLPIPSYARVTNLVNGKSIVVRINDRGPFLANRVIDLSYTAAYKLDVLANGSAPVTVESIIPGTASTSRGISNASAQSAPPASQQNNNIYLQLAAFGSALNAQSFLSQLRSELPAFTHNINITNESGLYKIHAGPYPNPELAQRTASEITQRLAIRPILTMR